MRLVRYGGTMSLDGYIAGPNGEYDWIVADPDIDFAGMMKQFDTFLIGRKTLEAMRRMHGEAPPTPGIRSIGCSRTLDPADYPGVTVEADGGGIPFLPPPSPRAMLKLLKQRVYEKTGTIGLEYEIVRA